MIGRLLVGRPEQQGAQLRHRGAQQGDGADVGLDVLDRHDAADQRDGRAPRPRVALDGRVVLHIDAVGDDRQPLGRGAVALLHHLVAAVERDDPAAELVAGARVADEGVEPDVAQVAPALLDVERRRGTVVEPLGHGDLDAALVGVDAVFGDEAAAAGLEHGARHHQAGITGRDGVIDARRRQLGQQHREHAAHQRAPAPEILQERTAGHRRLVHALQHAEGRFGVQQLRPVGDLRMAAQRIDHLAKGLAVTLAQQRAQGPLEAGDHRGGRAAGGNVALGLLQRHLGDPDHVGRQLEAHRPRCVVGIEHDEVEGQRALRHDQVVHPARHAAGDIGIGALDDEADVGFGAHAGSSRSGAWWPAHSDTASRQGSEMPAPSPAAMTASNCTQAWRNDA